MKLNSLIKLSLILLFFLVFSITAKAVDTQVLYTKSNLSIKDNSKITLKIYAKSDDLISGALIPWSFDTNKLKVTSIKSSKFNVTYKDQQGNLTKNIVLDSAKDYTGEIELFEIVFEATSNFKSGETTVIKFNPGQIANYRKTYKSAGAEFDINKSGTNNYEIAYEEIPVPVTLENDTSNNSSATKLDAGTTKNNNSSDKGNIDAIDTGVVIPTLAVSIFGCGFVGINKYSKKKGMLYKI